MYKHDNFKILCQHLCQALVRLGGSQRQALCFVRVRDLWLNEGEGSKNGWQWVTCLRHRSCPNWEHLATTCTCSGTSVTQAYGMSYVRNVPQCKLTNVGAALRKGLSQDTGKTEISVNLEDLWNVYIGERVSDACR